jgi:SAM-dependent methyltransferase
MTSLDDPEVVRREYATEAGLAARKAAYANAAGPNAPEVVFEKVAEVRPRRVLEVGCGEGELAERVQRELGAEVIAVDQSDRMVELTRARGVDARVGDVQDLEFPDASFDCAVAAWMLYHVRDIQRALDELSRVLEPGGTLIAVTNFGDHLEELRSYLGASVASIETFRGEDAGALLERRFSAVEVFDCSGTVTFADRAAALAYAKPWAALFGVELNPPELDGPLVARRRPVVFIATK